MVTIKLRKMIGDHRDELNIHGFVRCLYLEKPENSGRFGRSWLLYGIMNLNTIRALIRMKFDKLVELLEQREYIVPVFPAVPSCFTGRSTLVKGYISEYKTDYDIIVFLECDGDFKHTFCDDTRLQISTLSKNDNKTVAVLPTRWVQRHAEAGSYEPAFLFLKFIFILPKIQ